MRGVLRYSMSGHGWVIWASTLGCILTGLLGWFWTSVVLQAIQITALTSLIAQSRERRVPRE